MTARGLLSSSVIDELLGNPLPPARPLQISDESLVIIRDETTRLNQRLGQMATFRSYYEGEQALVYGTAEFKTKFGSQFSGFKDNWCKVVVNAMAHRLRIEGMSITEELDERADDMGVEVDALARAIWTVMARNNFDQQQDDLFTGTLVEGRASMIVWPDPVLGAKVDWNPGQNVIIRYDDDRRAKAWALKRWETPSGAVRTNLYFPDRIEKYRESGPTNTQNERQTEFQEMVADNDAGGGLTLLEIIENPLGEVPVVEFRNREGSEIRDTIAQQDALNYLMVAALSGAGLAGWPQRVMMTNVSEPTGGWNNDPGKVWQLPYSYDADGNPIESKIGEFTAADLDKFVNVTQEVLRHVASTSATPMRFFYQSDRGGRGDASSGEALRVDDEPLIDKLGAFQRRAGNSMWEVFRLVAKATSSITAPEPFPVGEPHWQDPQARHRTVLLQDAKLMSELGIPFEYYVEHLGLSPLEVKRVLRLKKEAEEKAMADAQKAMEAAAETNAVESNGSNPNPSPPTPPTPLPRPPSTNT